MRAAALALLFLGPLGAQEIAIQQVTEPFAPLRTKADALKHAKDWEGLADLMERQDPKTRGQFLFTWLEALSKAGRTDRALEICNAALPQLKAAKQTPEANAVQYVRSKLLSGAGRHEEALASFLELADQGDLAALSLACNEAVALGAWGDLMDLGSRVAQHNPGLGKSLRGDALAKLLRFPEAEALLEEAVKLPGHTAMAWSNLACCRVERKAYTEAVAAADQALALEPGLLEALYNRGRARFGLQQYAEGRADLAAALATGKADAALTENLKTNIALADRYLAHQARPAAKGRTKQKT